MFGPTHRIPFDVTVADHGMDAILVSPLAPLIEFTLEAPDGTVIDAAVAGADLVARPGVSYYRLALPIAGKMFHAGRWHALLRLDEKRIKTWLRDDRNQDRLQAMLRARAVPYEFVALAHSTLVLEAATSHGLVRPGERVAVTATLTEFGVPVEGRAEMWVEVSAPDGVVRRVVLTETAGGIFGADLPLAVPGAYQLRVRARGRSLHGASFTREQMLSVVAGIDRGTPPANEGAASGGADLLDLLECLTTHGDKPILGIDPEVLRKCLETVRRQAGTPKQREAPLKTKPRETSLKAREALVSASTTMTAGIVHLVEPAVTEVLVHDEHPMDHDDPNAPMFGLSPEDERVEDERRRKAPDPKGRPRDAAPGHDKGEG